MSKRYFTADWHLCSNLVNSVYNRPYADATQMNDSLIANCNNLVSENDILLHLGDFIIYGNEAGYVNEKINPTLFINKINGTFINIEGNHDSKNKMKSAGWFIQTRLGNTFRDVSMAHYPSYDKKIKNLLKPGWIHLCGHVHNSWKYYIDTELDVLNINVGVDVWDYKPVSELELILFIRKIMLEL